MATSLRDRLKVLFRKAPEAVEEAGIDPLEIDSVEFGGPSAPPPGEAVNSQGAREPVREALAEPEIAAQLAEFKATNDRLIAGQLHTCAVLFADSVIREAKAVPAQREQLIGLYKQSAVADGGGTIRFSAAGQVEEGANLKQLKELFKNAQPHTLFTTEIPNADPNEGQADTGLVERLRAATPLGQATIQKEAK